MRKDYYMHQKFLFDCDYENIVLPDNSCFVDEFIQNFTEEINLFDTESIITRKVKFSYLLEEIDTADDLIKFKEKIKFINKLVIENDMQQCANPIIAGFQKDCLKAFYKHIFS